MWALSSTAAALAAWNLDGRPIADAKGKIDRVDFLFLTLAKAQDGFVLTSNGDPLARRVPYLSPWNIFTRSLVAGWDAR